MMKMMILIKIKVSDRNYRRYWMISRITMKVKMYKYHFYGISVTRPVNYSMKRCNGIPVRSTSIRILTLISRKKKNCYSTMRNNCKRTLYNYCNRIQGMSAFLHTPSFNVLYYNPIQTSQRTMMIMVRPPKRHSIMRMTIILLHPNTPLKWYDMGIVKYIRLLVFWVALPHKKL